MNNYLMLLEASTSASGKGSFQMIILMVLLFVGMYFLMIRPQKKQQKKEQEIRENTQVGDEITTIGGIVGKVVTVKEDSLIIETGADKNKMKITRWAIQTNVTANEKIKAEREAAKAAAPVSAEPATTAGRTCPGSEAAKGIAPSLIPMIPINIVYIPALFSSGVNLSFPTTAAIPIESGATAMEVDTIPII